MVVGPHPFGTVARVFLGIVGGVWLAAGVLGIGLGLFDQHWLQVIVGVGALAVGVLYAGAARRGRPFRWPER